MGILAQVHASIGDVIEYVVHVRPRGAGAGVPILRKVEETLVLLHYGNCLLFRTEGFNRDNGFSFQSPDEIAGKQELGPQLRLLLLDKTAKFFGAKSRFIHT